MEKISKKRKIKGVVVSDKMEKTAVVLVTRIKKHKKYHKQYKSTKKYHVHNPENSYKKGDKVVIEETRPYSRTKKWRIVNKIK